MTACRWSGVDEFDLTEIPSSKEELAGSLLLTPSLKSED
jgi:hypothetical protein